MKNIPYGETILCKDMIDQTNVIYQADVSMGFSKSLFGMCDLENSILTFPTHSILSLLTNELLSKTVVRQW